MIFGNSHPLGIHKFLLVAWKNDELAGAANFDIERKNIGPGELVLRFEEMRPSKIRVFEEDLEAAFLAGRMESEADVVRFCIESGMTCQRATPVLKKLKAEGAIALGFRVLNVTNMRCPRSIQRFS